jgi:hypothetical protein
MSNQIALQIGESVDGTVKVFYYKDSQTVSEIQHIERVIKDKGIFSSHSGECSKYVYKDTNLIMIGLDQDSTFTYLILVTDYRR